MQFYRLSRMMMVLIGLPILAGFVIWACASSIYHEVSREKDYQQRFGDNWRTEYEDVFGPVSQARVRAGGGAVGIIAISSSLVWLFKVMRQQMAGPTSSRFRSKSSRSGGRRGRSEQSPIERAVRFRRKALLGVYFGVPGILFSVLLTLFRFGIFADHGSEVSLAIFIFLASYSAVVWGCYWWVKAKAWHEAVVFIAFMPLTVFLIPYVRLLVLAQLQLLMAAMVMMPLILVVVVAVLPDKSGLNRRRASWEKRSNSEAETP